MHNMKEFAAAFNLRPGYPNNTRRAWDFSREDVIVVMSWASEYDFKTGTLCLHHLRDEAAGNIIGVKGRMMVIERLLQGKRAVALISNTDPLDGKGGTGRWTKGTDLGRVFPLLRTYKERDGYYAKLGSPVSAADALKQGAR